MTAFSRVIANLLFPASLHSCEERARHLDGFRDRYLGLEGLELAGELIGAAQFRDGVALDGSDIVLGEALAPSGRCDVAIESG